MNLNLTAANSGYGRLVDIASGESRQLPKSSPAESRANSSTKSGKALVLGEDSKILLPIIRSLGRKQIAVDVAWAPRDSAFARSGYLRRMHDLPAWKHGDEQWFPALKQLAQQENYDLIIPATEAALWPLLENRQLSRQLPELLVLNERAAQVAFDKSRLQQLAIELGIPMPNHRLVHSWQEFADFVKHQQGSVVFKPLCSISAEQIRGKQFVRIVHDTDDLLELRNDATAGWPAIAQTWFAGQGAGIEFLADAGELLFVFQHQRLHETVGYGSTYRRSVAVQQDMLVAVQKLIRATDYTGVGMAEFRVNTAAGDWVLLELNGRFWGSLALAIAAGADFPHYLYCLRVHGRRVFPGSYRTGVRCRDLINDTRWCWRALRGQHRSALNASLESQGWEINRKSRRSILGNLMRVPLGLDRYDSFAWDDPKPFWFELRHFGQFVRRKKKS